MSIIIDNNSCTDVIYKGKPSDVLYLAGAECWRKKKEAYLTTGTAINSALNKEAVAFSRSVNAPAESVTSTDISKDGDNSVITWYDSTSKTQYYYCPSNSIYLNADSSNIFADCAFTIDLSIFKWDNVESMEYAFGYGKMNLDFSSCNLQNVKNMSSAFDGFNAYGKDTFTIDLSNNDMPNLENMYNAFGHTEKLIIKLPKSTSKLTNTSYMFNITKDITIDFGQFDTSHVTNMEQMFLDFASTTKRNKFTPRLNTSSVQNFKDMFTNIGEYVKELDLSSFDISSATNMCSFLYNSYNIEFVIWGDHFIPSNELVSKCITTDFDSKHEIFNPTANMMQIAVDWDTNNFSIPVPDWSGFNGKWMLSGEFILDIAGYLTTGPIINAAINKNATSFVYKYDNYYNYQNKTDISANGDWSAFTWYDEKTTTQYWYCSNSVMTFNPDSSEMFAGCSKLTKIKLNDYTSKITDTSKVTDFQNMFDGCSALTEISYGNKFVLPMGVSDTCTANDTTNKTYMAFNNCPANKPPLWEKGTWETNGTFIAAPKTYANLATGNDIHTAMWLGEMDNLQSIERSVTPPAEGTTTKDISAEKDGSIVTWRSGTTQYIYTEADMVYMNPDSSFMFSAMRSINNIDLSYWDSSKVTNMNGLFAYSAIRKLDIKHWDTSKVTTMDTMFQCPLESVDISNWDVSNVTSMNTTFQGCKFTSLDLSGWNTSNVTNMGSVFIDCDKLVSLDLSNFDTTNVTNMATMFGNCTSLTSLNISPFNTSKVANMSYMFNECTALTNITYGSNFVNTVLAGMSNDDSNNGSYYMFSNCPGNKPTWTGGEWTIDGTFVVKQSTETTLLSGKEFNNKFNYYADSFVKSAAAPEASVSTEDISEAQDGSVVTWYDSATYKQYWYSDCDIVYLNPDCSGMFSTKESLETLDMREHGFDTSKVTNMSSMFSACTRLTTLNLSNFDTSNVIDMAGMFSSCYALTSLDISSFDTTNVAYMSNMFADNTSPQIVYGDKFVNTSLLELQSTEILNESRWMFSNSTANKPNWTGGTWNANNIFVLDKPVRVTTMTGLSHYDSNSGWSKCINDFIDKNATIFKRSDTAPPAGITASDISEAKNRSVVTWYDADTTTQYWYSEADKVYLNKETDGMFEKCSALTSIDLSGFDTSDVRSLYGFFSECSSLTTLDLSGFDTSNVADMGFMFENCTKLTTITYGDKFKILIPNKTYSSYLQTNMYNNCPANKPTGGNWDLVEWSDTGSAKTPSANIISNDSVHIELAGNINKSATIFKKSPTEPSVDITTTDITTKQDNSVVTWYDEASTTQYWYSAHDYGKVKISNGQNLFKDYTSLVTLDLTGIWMDNISRTSGMFQNCSSLKTIIYDKSFEPSYDMMDNIYLYTENMFTGTDANKPTGGLWDSLKWDVSKNRYEPIITSKVSIDPSKLKKYRYMSAVSFKRIDNVPPISKSFDISIGEDRSVVTWYDISTKTQYWYSKSGFVYLKGDCRGLFAEWDSLKTLNLDKIRTNEATSLIEMFQYCKADIDYGGGFEMHYDVSDSCINPTPAYDETNLTYHMYYCAISNKAWDNPTPSDTSNGGWRSDGTYALSIL